MIFSFTQYIYIYIVYNINLSILKIHYLSLLILILRGGYVVIFWTFDRSDAGSKPPIYLNIITVNGLII